MGENKQVVELILVNGTTDGLIKVKLGNWNGNAFKISRNEIEGSKEKGKNIEIDGIGVYFLYMHRWHDWY